MPTAMLAVKAMEEMGGSGKELFDHEFGMSHDH
jgi:hypothetical protein